MNKFELVKRAIGKSLNTLNHRRKILDVGCRGCELRKYVEEFADYVGVDLYQNPEGSVTHVLDVSKGLPFSDSSFSDVIALDLVEHLDDFEGGMRELLRVTKANLIVMLPNMAHPIFRFKFLFTGRLSGKYDLVYGQGQDRHRWLTTLTQSDEFMRKFSAANELELQIILFNDSRKKVFVGNLCKMMRLSPELWTWASLYVLSRNHEA